MMAKELQLGSKAPGRTLAMHPQKFALWLFLCTVMMIFAAMTSAHIVRQADGNWMEYDMPSMLWITSGIIIFSSISMHWAYLAAKKDNYGQVKIAMIITCLLAAAFIVGQFRAWGELVDAGVFFVGNPAGSFLYVFTGLHLLHLVSGIFYLLYILVQSLRQKVNSKNMLNMEMCSTYWHFLGGLWIYLFIFLLMNH
jgi:cytochrome c oxidase subunit III